MKGFGSPDQVIDAIRKAAERDFHVDDESSSEFVTYEILAYRELLNLDFGAAASARQDIIDRAFEMASSWQERQRIIQHEVSAFYELQEWDSPDVPEEMGKPLTALKAEAAQLFTDYCSQADYVRDGMAGYIQAYEKRMKLVDVVEHDFDEKLRNRPGKRR